LAVNTTPAAAGGSKQGHYQHVLLISIDGMHASDLTQCEANGDCPNLAMLAGDGTTYTHAMTSEPSDSAPGTMALLTGGDPKLTGVYYDDSYDRTMYQPAAQTTTSTQNCFGPAGAETMLAENVDTNAPSTANGQVGTRTILNETVDPTQLPYALQNGMCEPVLANDFLRTNSVMSVAHAAGLRTAWADKHPVYNAEVAGHGTPNAVDDPFNTEINADIVPPTLTDTRGNTVTFPLPNPTGDPNGFFITDSVGNTEAYDQIKVDAILNEIDGMNSANTQQVGVPAIFGMNFQAVSVGQKLVDPMLSCVRSNNALGCDPSYVPGGYEPGTFAFTPQLAGAVKYVDGAIGSMVQELAKEGGLDSTKIIISAKHGQSPIDPSQLALIGHAETAVLKNAGITPAQVTDDDVALIWLADQSQTKAAVQALQADKAGANTAHIQYILAGPSLAQRFNSPLVDPRTPDIIIQPIPGTIYSTSNAKVMEHGGFATDDTHVMMLVVDGWRIGGGQTPSGKWQMHSSKGSISGSTVNSPVTTYQVAPTILAALGLNPRQLDSVRIEHVRVLPGRQ
jgi:hypothetical protein